MVRGARSVSPTPARGSGGSGRWFQGSASGGGVSAMITGSGGGQNLVAQTAPRETGVSLKYPVLTRTNYTDWALLMRVNLQAQGVWDAVDSGGAEFRVDRMALAAILQAVPPEMLGALATKSTAKSAWEAIRTMRMGVERVREARLELGSIKRPPITREEIVNACGVEDVHDGTNYSRTACVIAVAKAHDTFEPFLHQFGFRLLYILKRPFPTSVFLLEKDGGHFSSHDVLVKRVQAAFNKFAKSTEQSCRERCMEDLEGTTRYVTRSLHNKNRAGLWHFLDSFVALEQLSVNTHTAHSTGLHDQSSGLNDSKQNRSKGDSISFHSSDANSPAPVSEARLVDVLHSTLWNRRLAPSSERLVYALVHQIFHGIKEHFLVTTELKFNCFLLMPIVDKLPALLREDLRSALENDLDSILDVTTAPLIQAEEARAGD